MTETTKHQVTISYELPTKIIIREIVTYKTIDEFSKNVAILSMRQGGNLALMWGNGVVFLGAPIMASEGYFANLFLEGTMVFPSVMCSKMERHQSILKASQVEILVVDVSNSPIFNGLSKFLSEFVNANEAK